MIRARIFLLTSIMLLTAGAAAAEPSDWGHALARARGPEYLSLRARVAALPSSERAALLERAQSEDPSGFEAAGLLLAASLDAGTRSACHRLVYGLRGLDSERLAQRRRKDPEAASHLRAAVRNGCEAMVLELALRPELYELESTRSLAGEQRAALERGLVIALGGARSAPARGYLASMAAAPGLGPELGRRVLEAYGQAAGPSATPTLRAIAEQASRSAEHRAGALIGLGFTGDPAARTPLAALLRHPDPTLATAALVGLSTLASSTNPAATEALRREVSRTLVSLLATAEAEHGDRVLDALAYVAHPSALEDLAGLRAADASPRLSKAERRLGRALARAGHSAAGPSPARPPSGAASPPPTSPGPRSR